MEFEIIYDLSILTRGGGKRERVFDDVSINWVKAATPRLTGERSAVALMDDTDTDGVPDCEEVAS
eukprot:m.210750 g.210750  ORF g.210750 m.210750 type:complete len:65 (+) comp16938_c1_seq1:350-544(+)